MGDPLVGLKAQVNWKAFRSDLERIHAKARKNNAGAKPIDVVLMFKILVLQPLNNLSDDRIEYQIRDRTSLGHPLSEAQKADNHKKSNVRSRVEHVFGTQAQMGGHWVRTIGLLRAKVKIGMMNLVYNMMRLVQLARRKGDVAPTIA